MKISIKESHIENGKRLDCSSCPISLALMDAGFTNVYVAYETISYMNPNSDMWKEHPNCKKIKSFISNYDVRKKVKPFSFNLEE